jgi:electron transfer flavoprotein beta subunit
VTTDLRLNEPRFAKLPDIMKAKRKPLETKTFADLGVEVKQHIQLDKVEAPAARQGGVKVGSVDELIQKLKDEAKVI